VEVEESVGVGVTLGIGVRVGVGDAVGDGVAVEVPVGVMVGAGLAVCVGARREAAGCLAAPKGNTHAVRVHNPTAIWIVIRVSRE